MVRQAIKCTRGEAVLCTRLISWDSWINTRRVYHRSEDQSDKNFFIDLPPYGRVENALYSPWHHDFASAWRCWKGSTISIGQLSTVLVVMCLTEPKSLKYNGGSTIVIRVSASCTQWAHFGKYVVRYTYWLSVVQKGFRHSGKLKG
jgi:hypothetical protein